MPAGTFVPAVPGSSPSELSLVRSYFEFCLYYIKYDARAGQSLLGDIPDTTARRDSGRVVGRWVDRGHTLYIYSHFAPPNECRLRNISLPATRMIDGAVLARQPSCHKSGEARGGKSVSLCYFTTSAMKAALSVARSPDGRAVARSMESQGTLLGMPSGAGVKEEDMDRPAHSFCMCITEGTRNTRKTRPANLCAHISLFHTDRQQNHSPRPDLASLLRRS